MSSVLFTYLILIFSVTLASKQVVSMSGLWWFLLLMMTIVWTWTDILLLPLLEHCWKIYYWDNREGFLSRQCSADCGLHLTLICDLRPLKIMIITAIPVLNSPTVHDSTRKDRHMLSGICTFILLPLLLGSFLQNLWMSGRMLIG